MKYKMSILTKEKEYSYIVSTLSAYSYDKILGFDNTISDLKKLDNLEKITNNMISPNFLEEFYRKIIDKEKKYAEYYKDNLLFLIYHTQFESFLEFEVAREPNFIYIESYRNNEGDYTKYDYVNSKFNYEYVVKEFEKESRKI